MSSDGSERVYALDGLRGLAAYTVAFSHFTLTTKYMNGIFGLSGQVAVMVFFVLSGYLMGALYLRRDFATRGVKRYFIHRFGRVLPLYFLVVAVSFFHFQMTGSISPFFPVTSATLFEHAFFIRGISVLWSIPVEVQFYVLFPLLWFAYSRWGDTALLWAGLVICAVAFLGFPQTPVVGFYLPFFLTGVICSRINPKIGNGMNAVFVVAMVGYVYCWPEISGLRGIWTAMQYPILMAVIVLSTANSRWASITLGHPIARYFGKISYSVYLWHLPVLLAYEDLGFVPDNKASFVGIYLVSVTIAASISFYLFEDPMRRLIYGERPIWKSPLKLPGIGPVKDSATAG